MMKQILVIGFHAYIFILLHASELPLQMHCMQLLQC